MSAPIVRLTASQKVEVLYRADAGECITKIAEMHGVTRQAIRGLLRRRGRPARPMGKLTVAQRSAAVERYISGESIGQVAASYGVAEPSIRGILLRRGVEIRKVVHTLRHEAFDQLTAESMYWIGFLFADGSVHFRSGHLPQISLGLAERDQSHLLALRAFLGSTSAISTSLRTHSSCQFSVRSQRLAERLISLGRYDEIIDAELSASRDFWRGVVDGDGSIGAYPRSKGSSVMRPQFRLVGRSALLSAFVHFLEMRAVASLSVRPHKTIYGVGTTGRSAVRIIELLYSGAVTALPRKAQAAAQLMEMK